MAEALLSLGGNVGDSRALLDRAVTRLCDGNEVRLTVRSSDYRTPPWGDEEQPPFVNLCIAVDTTLLPHALLQRAHAVEHELDRERAGGRRWGPRTVDIDILAYDDMILDEPTLTLPHLHMFQRAFVLVPLAEIAPDRLIAGRSAREALEGMDISKIEKLPPRSPRPA